MTGTTAGGTATTSAGESTVLVLVTIVLIFFTGEILRRLPAWSPPGPAIVSSGPDGREPADASDRLESMSRDRAGAGEFDAAALLAAKARTLSGDPVSKAQAARYVEMWQVMSLGGARPTLSAELEHYTRTGD